MSAQPNPAPIELADEKDFSLGPLSIRPSSCEVLSPKGVEVLQPRVMKVLVALARRPGQVMSRDRLVSECWAGRVVGEDAIERSIASVRRLAETHAGFRIETIARVGYRLTQESAPLPENAAPSPSHSANVPASNDDPQRLPGRANPRALRVGVALAVAAIGLSIAIYAAVRWQSVSPPRSVTPGQLAQINGLVQKDQYGAAFVLALPLIRDERTRSNPELIKLWSQIVLPFRPLVAEEGATVYFKPYADVDGEWLSAKPANGAAAVDAPRGALRVKVEKPGFRTGYFAVANPGPSVGPDPAPPPSVKVPLPLIREGTLSDDMVLVPRTDIPVYLGLWSSTPFGNDQHDIPAFAIARCEVTNSEFKSFVDAGGYENPVWWQGLKFRDQGREISWAQARLRFVDATGRAGPAGWALSTYPTGQGEIPVGGISWYEAVAYARFRGATLPTIHHWMRAAFAPYEFLFNTAPAVAALSHFGGKSPIPARDAAGLGPWGTVNMAGNVSEWVWNAAGSNAIVLGGAWSEESWSYQLAHPVSAMDRSAQIGLRLMRTLPGASVDAQLLEPIHLASESPEVQRKPVSDDAFAAMRLQFSNTHLKPLAVAVQVLEQTPLWISEEVTLKFPEEQTRVLYIVRPRNHAQPLQPVIYGPPGNCCQTKRPNREAPVDAAVLSPGSLETIVNGGRALVIPIWAGSYERVLPPTFDSNVLTDRQRGAALVWHQDMSTTLDYLGTRADFDTRHGAYFGYSYGAKFLGALDLAIEPRLKAAVLMGGGVGAQKIHPMIDLVNYAPRIHIPVLMLNGVAERTDPLFDLLGTPTAMKSHVFYDAGHFTFPPNSVARDTNNWLDQYLGPVR
jgi:eukaryotic-like serine/threonine-protein kinase